MMDLPLSPTPADALNYHAPANTKRYGLYEVESFRNLSSEMRAPADGSSPMIMDAAGDALNMSDQENVSPSKRRSHHRVISGTELSPLKILNRKRSSPDSGFDGSMAPPPLRNPRRLSPEKRFPVKVSGSGETFAAMAERKANPDADRSREVDVEELVRNNAGLQKAIDIFEDDCKLDDDDEHDTTTMKKRDETQRKEDAPTEEDDEATAADDTMMSTFSTFSAIPDVAGLARTKLAGGSKPNVLNDYTDSLRNLRRSPEKKPMITMPQPTPGVSSTPNRAQRATLDFDIPPMPTPRSVPTVSAREVESLKSGYLSEISSLKASLSGKEAEVRSLKAAVGDAEQRVGETMEQLREEKDSKDQLTHERDEWEKHSREVERVLTQAKEQIESRQQQQEDLEQKLEESEKRREAAEMLHQEAESKIAGMRAGKACDKPTADNKPQDASAISQQVAIAVERAARDLHALYKGKHETKIAGLKKAYEARWDKKIRLLEERVAALTEENTKLQSSAGSANHHNSNINQASEAHADELEKHRARAVKDSATIKELGANVRRLEAEMSSVQNDNADIRSQLEQERVEKGELVQLAEELMKMQATEKERPQRVAYQPEGPLMPGKTPAKTPAKTPRRSEVRASIGSIGRASAIRAPGSALRRPRESLNAGGFTSSRQSMSGMSSRSSMMSSVEHTSSNYRGRYE